MPPPPAPTSASAHGQHTHRSPVSPSMSGYEQAGPGPARHPRPLTAAEMYLECEKEQEAVVNRLTRELTALRARSASVTSNTSQSSANSNSASLLPIDISDPNPTHNMTGATHPTPSRRPRSDSSVSTRSIPTPSTSVSATGSSITNFSTQVQAGSTTSVPVGGVSQASADRAAAAGGSTSLSRQPSVSTSGTSTPARQSLDFARHGGGGVSGGGSLYTLPHRPSLSRDPSYASAHHANSTTAQPGAQAPIPHPLPSPAQSPGASGNPITLHSDPSAYRTEMEIVKAENEMLRHRVRNLERALRARRRDSSQSDATRPDLGARVASGREGTVSSPAGVAAWAAGDGGVGGVAGPRERSESQSTTASSRRGVGGGGEDEVRVGESAGSVGLGRAF
ncbi:hypothetical protein B0A50_04582 [Salinomyces thailandicus]|uniref:Uncharacterized protein n=1 Tax=Salinomyces thailandicus TaxID=706561 RepID=A0A4U0TVQ2_9PEZI|nr:hypothetical protein B0A50_04582 [Salinomyces thailandica]